MNGPYYTFVEWDSKDNGRQRSMATCDNNGKVHDRAGYLGPQGWLWVRRDDHDRIVDGLQDRIALLEQFKIRCKLMNEHIEYLKKRCTDNGIEPYPKDGHDNQV